MVDFRILHALGHAIQLRSAVYTIPLHKIPAPTVQICSPNSFQLLGGVSLNRRPFHHTARVWTIECPSSSTPIEGCFFSLQFLHQLTCVFSLAVRLYPAPKPICWRRVPERPDYLAPPAVFVGSHSLLATPSLVRSIHNHLQGSLQDMH